MNYTLNAGCWSGVFAVPNGVVDKYIRISDGNCLKLLLFLLRHGGESFSDEDIVRELGFRCKGEAEDAAEFWIQRGVIRYDAEKTSEEENVFTPSEKKPVPIESVKGEDKPPEEKKEYSSLHKVENINGLYRTSGDIAGRINSDSAVAYLFKEAEALYCRRLRPQETQNVLALVDHYGLPAAVAVLLLKYCFRSGKSTPAYIQKVAASWSEDGIDSVELADARVKILERRDSTEERLRNAMELKSKLTARQREFIRKWTVELGYDDDMIMLAYDITVDSIGQMKFEYANSILENWNKQGISTKEEAERNNEQYKRSAAKGKANQSKAVGDSNSSFDADEVMQQIIESYQNS